MFLTQEGATCLFSRSKAIVATMDVSFEVFMPIHLFVYYIYLINVGILFSHFVLVCMLVYHMFLCSLYFVISLVYLCVDLG